MTPGVNRDEQGAGDDVPCIACGMAALQRNLVCSECGHDNWGAIYGMPFTERPAEPTLPISGTQQREQRTPRIDAMTDEQSRPAVGVPLDGPVGRHLPERVTLVCVLEQQRYRPGDQAPAGYLAWHEWAEVQHKAGLRQKQCGRCGLWRYPQQLSALVDSTEVTGLRKRQPFRRTLETPVCNDCAAKADSKTPNANSTADPAA